MDNYSQVGSCPRCGSPIYVPTFYWSILPPSPIRTCDCFPSARVITTDHTNGFVESGENPNNHWAATPYWRTQNVIFSR